MMIVWTLVGCLLRGRRCKNFSPPPTAFALLLLFHDTFRHKLWGSLLLVRLRCLLVRCLLCVR